MAKKKTAGEGTQDGDEAASRPYVVLARKYRPQTFDDLIGQEAMVRTLSNAFASGRIAQGYMLTGVRGVGKTTTARILARAFNYETDTIDKPTMDMPVLGRHCADIIDSRHPDVIEMDAASNTGIDNIREIIESARYKPILARTKVFIIDEVHMLSKAAFNGLLKTLEEPPEHVKFIFATTEIRKVPVTVLSRCQRFDLRRVDVPALSEHFRRISEKEGASADSDALAMIARAAEGSVRDGLSLLDQAIAMGSGHVTAETARSMLGLADRGRIFDLVELLFGGTPGAALQAFEAIYHDGAEPAQLLADLAEAIHIATRMKAVGADAASEGLSAEEKRRAGAIAAKLSVPLLARAWQMLLKGIEETNRAPDPVAAAEMAIVRIAYTADLPSPDEIIKSLGGESIAARRSNIPASQVPPNRRAPLNEAPESPSEAEFFEVVEAGVPSDGPMPDEPDIAAFDDGDGADDASFVQSTPVIRPLQTFADVIALVAERRDARLRVHLEDYISLVKFDGANGSIDLFLLPDAPPELANELREKLNKWTGRRWVVMLSKSRGEPTVGEVRRERAAADLAAAKRHPAVAAILEAFPDAKIADVRRVDDARDDETGTG